MTRESDKHGPRVDEEMKKETQSVTQGAPVESRAQESREKEGGGDGQPSPEGVAGRTGEDVPPRSLSQDDLQARTELARFLDGAIFPASREEVLDNARERHAPPEVIEQLGRLPAGRYEGFPEVWTSLGGRVEGDRRQG